jgi:hypothetical protein
VTDQVSILRFIEDNWNLGRIGDNSWDTVAGSLAGMFNFQGTARAQAVLLDPNTGTVTSVGLGGNTSAVTTAVANPKNATTTNQQIQLDGTASISADGKSLTFKWTQPASSLVASISGDNTPTPLVQFTSGPGVYAFTLTVTDSKGNTSTDSTSVTVMARPH